MSIKIKNLPTSSVAPTSADYVIIDVDDTLGGFDTKRIPIDTFFQANSIVSKTTLTDTQVKALNTPFDLISAPAANEFIAVDSAFIEVVFNTTAYDTSARDLSLRFSGMTNDLFTAAQILDETADTGRQFNPDIIVTGTQLPRGTALQIVSTNGVAPTLGDSDINIYIKYSIIKGL